MWPHHAEVGHPSMRCRARSHAGYAAAEESHVLWLVMTAPMVMALAAVLLARPEDPEAPATRLEPPCRAPSCSGPVRARRPAPPVRERRAAHSLRSRASS